MPNNNWKLAEVKGYEYFMEKGYRILISIIENSGFDFVANKGKEYIQVNVKLAGRTRETEYL